MERGDEPKGEAIGALADPGPRGALLRAASEVFGLRGAGATTVEDLLRAADVSRRTFYRFFAGKDEVLDALHGAASEVLLASARRASREARSPLEHVERLIDAYLAVVRRGGRLLLVLQGEASRAGSPLAARRQRVLATLVAMVRDDLRAQLGRDVDPYAVLGAILGAEGIARRLIEDGDTEPRAARARASMLRVVTATLLAGDAGVAPLPPAPCRE